MLIEFNQLDYLDLTMTIHETPRIKRYRATSVWHNRVTIGEAEVIEVDFMRSNNL